MAKPTRDSETLVDRIIRRGKNSRVIATIIVGALVVGGAAKVADAARSLAMWDSPANGLALASETAKGEMSRELTRSAWKRLFWMRSYLSRVKLGAPADDQSEAWRNYMAASEAWNAELMNNIEFLRRYYPNTAKADSLEVVIQAAFGSVGEELAELRYQSNGWQSAQRQLAISHDSTGIDELNSTLYAFVTGLTPPKSH